MDLTDEAAEFAIAARLLLEKIHLREVSLYPKFAKDAFVPLPPFVRGALVQIRA